MSIQVRLMLWLLDNVYLKYVLRKKKKKKQHYSLYNKCI